MSQELVIDSEKVDRAYEYCEKAYNSLMDWNVKLLVRDVINAEIVKKTPSYSKVKNLLIDIETIIQDSSDLKKKVKKIDISSVKISSNLKIKNRKNRTTETTTETKTEKVTSGELEKTITEIDKALDEILNTSHEISTGVKPQYNENGNPLPMPGNRPDIKNEDIKKLEECAYQYQQLSQLKFELEQLSKIQPYEDVIHNEDFEEVSNKEIKKEETLRMGPVAPDMFKSNEKYLTETQKQVYRYLYHTEGEEKSNEYIKALENQINQSRGFEEAIEELKQFHDDPLWYEEILDISNATGDGFTDNFASFAEDVDNLFSNSNIPSSLYYKKLFITQILNSDSLSDDIKEMLGEQKAEEILGAVGRKELNFSYQFGGTIGYMAPSIIVSAATGGVSSVGAVTMGLGSAGGAKKQALISGSSVAEANIYGILSGMSEATLGYFLGSIPGLSKNTQGIKALFMEGTEELTQEYIDAALRHTILGEEIDIQELAKSSVESFAMGVLVSSVMNGGELAVTKGVEKTVTTANNIKIKIDTKKLMEEIKNGNYEYAETIKDMVNGESTENIINEETSNSKETESVKTTDTNFAEIALPKSYKQLVNESLSVNKNDTNGTIKSNVRSVLPTNLQLFASNDVRSNYQNINPFINQSQSINSTQILNDAFVTMSNKWGSCDTAVVQILEYYKTADPTKLTRTNNVRNNVMQLDKNDIKLYLNNLIEDYNRGNTNGLSQNTINQVKTVISTNTIEEQIAKANNYAQKGNFMYIKLDSINNINEEMLKKVIDPVNTLFSLDGKTYTYLEIKEKLGLLPTANNVKANTIEEQIELANLHAKSGRFAEIKLENINNINEEMLKKIDDPVNALFSLDGKTYTYSDIKLMLEKSTAQNNIRSNYKNINPFISQSQSTKSNKKSVLPTNLQLFASNEIQSNYQNINPFINQSQSIKNNELVNKLVSSTTNGSSLILERFKNAKKYTSDTEIAIKYKDSVQYLYIKLEQLANSTGDPELLDAYYRFKNVKNADKNYDELHDVLSPYLDSNDENLLAKMNSENNIGDQLTKEEKNELYLYSRTTGPILAAYERGKDTQFVGKNGKKDILPGSDKVKAQRSFEERRIVAGDFSKNKTIENSVKIIDKIINKAEPLQEDTILYRGTNSLFFDGEFIDLGDLKVGQLINDKATVSTSLLESKSYGHNKIMLEILAPKGTKGAYIESFVGGYNQQEYLLARNTTFKVISNPEIDSSTGITKIKVEIVKPDTFVKKLKNKLGFK